MPLAGLIHLYSFGLSNKWQPFLHTRFNCLSNISFFLFWVCWTSKSFGPSIGSKLVSSSFSSVLVSYLVLWSHTGTTLFGLSNKFTVATIPTYTIQLSTVNWRAKPSDSIVICLSSLLTKREGAVHKLCNAAGGWGGLTKRYYCIFLLFKSIRILTESVTWGKGGQKLPILALHNLWIRIKHTCATCCSTKLEPAFVPLDGVCGLHKLHLVRGSPYCQRQLIRKLFQQEGEDEEQEEKTSIPKEPLLALINDDWWLNGLKCKMWFAREVLQCKSSSPFIIW